MRVFESLGSTQDLCRELAEAGEPAFLAVLAHRQTQARGSKGRDWSSPAGNLALSILLRPRVAARAAAQWSLLAGVALADAIAAYLGPANGLRLKWPNDVLLDGRKLAGILAESAAAGEALAWLVIGFGVNIATAPEIPDRRTACLAERGPPPSPEAFACGLMQQLSHWQAIRLDGGFAAIRAAWLDRAPALGTPLSLKLGVGTFGGAFAGLAEDGALLLQQPDGCVRAFAAGET